MHVSLVMRSQVARHAVPAVPAVPGCSHAAVASVAAGHAALPAVPGCFDAAVASVAVGCYEGVDSMAVVSAVASVAVGCFEDADWAVFGMALQLGAGHGRQAAVDAADPARPAVQPG